MDDGEEVSRAEYARQQTQEDSNVLHSHKSNVYQVYM